MMRIPRQFYGVVALIMILLTSASAFAQESLSQQEKMDIISSLSSQNFSWKKVSLNGKLKMKGLPVSPSLKVFMEYDKSLMISVRAPLMGEVGRMEIRNDSILGVNKMKKIYFHESLRSIRDFYPGTLSELQELLLGRPVIPGEGTIKEGSRDRVDMYRTVENEYYLIPDSRRFEGYNYGYMLDSNPRLSALLILNAFIPDMSFSLEYSYEKKDYRIKVTYTDEKGVLTAELNLDYPVYGSGDMEPIKLNGKYQRVSFYNFLKSF